MGKVKPDAAIVAMLAGVGPGNEPDGTTGEALEAIAATWRDGWAAYAARSVERTVTGGSDAE